MVDPRIAEVLRFWFEELKPEQHWVKDEGLDTTIRDRFGALNAEAASGALDGWTESADGALALVIVLDQFSRNLFRGSPDSFANDAKALAVAQQAIACGHDASQPVDRRKFLYMPFEHSEDLAMQEESLRLFQTLDPAKPVDEYAVRHHEIIARFGRFPHRNAVMGRESTPEEVAFLKEPNSAF